MRIKKLRLHDEIMSSKKVRELFKRLNKENPDKVCFDWGEVKITNLDATLEYAKLKEEADFEIDEKNFPEDLKGFIRFCEIIRE